MSYSFFRYEGNCSMILATIMCYQYCEKNNLSFKGSIAKKQKSSSMDYSYNKIIRNIKPLLKYLNLPRKAEPDKHNLITFNKYMNIKITPEFCKTLHDNAKNNFYPIKKNPSEFIVTIHIRRGDVTDSGKWKRRFTPDEVYLKFIKKIYELKPNAKVYIFSQEEGFKNGKYYQDYLKLNCILKLVPYSKKGNDNTFVETFNYFIMSDIFLIASSSFSIVPALFKNNGLTVYPDNFCLFNPLENWININNDELYEKIKLM